MSLSKIINQSLLLEMHLTGQGCMGKFLLLSYGLMCKTVCVCVHANTLTFTEHFIRNTTDLVIHAII